MPNSNELAVRGVRVVVVVLSSVAIYLVFARLSPGPVPLRSFDVPVFTGMIASLLAIALFVERAIEVVVMVFRDADADLLDQSVAEAQTEFDRLTALSTGAAGNIASTQAERSTAVQSSQTAQKRLDEAHRASIVYRAKTKEFALQVGLAFGVLVSLAGVRTLHGLVDWNALKDIGGALPPASRIFTVADVAVTGALLAGGSEGIHRIANVFTSFMDSTSTRIDQQTSPKK